MSVLREMIQYMYTAEVSAGYDNFEDLLILANKYQVTHFFFLLLMLYYIHVLLAKVQYNVT